MLATLKWLNQENFALITDGWISPFVGFSANRGSRRKRRDDYSASGFGWAGSRDAQDSLD